MTGKHESRTSDTYIRKNNPQGIPKLLGKYDPIKMNGKSFFFTLKIWGIKKLNWKRSNQKPMRYREEKEIKNVNMENEFKIQSCKIV